MPDHATGRLTIEATVAADALSAHAQYLRDLADVEVNPFAQLGLRDAARRADEAASGYAKPVPPLPAEPPVGAVCRGYDTDLWQRIDVGNGYGTWFLNGLSHRYGAAIDEGMCPNRRLIELPDPDDEDAMEAVRSIVSTRSRDWDPSPHLVAWVVVALAESGQPGGDSR